ncbi:MAG: phage portal protein [Chloroflexi bacterium]|nr:phage portal protein [Chloroflexota bacterium]
MQRRNRAGSADLDPISSTFGRGGGWANPEYGAYYASSVSVYAAIKLRADAISRPAVRLYRTTPDGARQEAGPQHPARQLLERVNPWFTRGDLWQATEIYLNLWGQAFWALERDTTGRMEIWPLRPDRVSALPDRDNYIRGFVYRGQGGTPVAYAADEIVWLRYFNPLEEYAGLSPLAPARLSVDMGGDGLRFNRNFLRNSAQPDFVLLTDAQLTDSEVEEFYNRWDSRYRGPQNARRPAIANFVKDIRTLGLSHRDMDFIRGLRWSLEEVSRAYGVPKPLLADLERATFANINAAERIFWRNTIVPEIRFLEEHLNRMLLPKLGFPELFLEFDLTSIEAMQEDENSRVARQMQLLDRGVLTINEVRRQQKLPDVPWGDTPLRGRGSPSAGSQAGTGEITEQPPTPERAASLDLPGMVSKGSGQGDDLVMQNYSLS